MNGIIVSTKEVHCGKCEFFVGGLRPSSAADELRGLGWRKVRPFGWCCSTCVRTLATHGGSNGG
jgi:hypothetical protein